MKNAIIVHGMPDKEEYLKSEIPAQSHWLPWLAQELSRVGYEVAVPEMPQPYEPRYEQWKIVFEQNQITNETLLVGHSCGAGFLIRFLSEQDIQVGRVVLVAPWIDPYHKDHNLVADFFDFEIDKHLVSKTAGITIIVSTDDEESVLQTVAVLNSEITGIEIKQMTNRGHFTKDDMGTNEFPEVLAMCA